MSRAQRKDIRRHAEFQNFPPMTFHVPFSPPPESLTNARRRQYHLTAAKNVSSLKEDAGWYIKSQFTRWLQDHGPITGAVRIHANIGWEWGRWPDFDAPALAIKAIIDQMVELGVMVDDSQVEYYSTHRERSKGETGHIILRLEPYNHESDRPEW